MNIALKALHSFLLISLVATPVFAQFVPEFVTAEFADMHENGEPVPTPSPTPVAEVSGQLGLSPWLQTPAHKPQEFNLKGRVRIDGWVNLTDDGCLKLRARATSGEKFNNEWINTGLGTENFEFQVALRQLYLSATCLKKVQIEAGSVPVRNYGNMGLSDNGSIGGVQITVFDEAHRREWLLSAGRVAPEADLLSRGSVSVNHVSGQVRQGIGEKVSAYASLSGYEQNLYTRAGIQWALGQYLGWLKEQDIGGDVLFSDSKFMGVMGFTRFNVREWKSRIAFSNIIQHPAEADRLAFLMKQFYGYGRNLYLETSRDYSKRLTLNARVRIGEAGPMALAGITWKFRSAVARH